jgi:hypothetical protein
MVRVRMVALTGFPWLLAGCAVDAPGPSAPGGGVVVQVEIAPGQSRALDAGQYHLTGPTTRSASAQPGTDVAISGLEPGQYTLALEGFVAGAVELYGVTSGIQVTGGQNTPATVTLASFVPSITSLPPSVVSASTTFGVGFSQVANAASYQIETATDSAFTRNIVSTNAGQSPSTVGVPVHGRYFVRVRAKDPFAQLSRATPIDSIRVQECQNCWRTREALSAERENLAVATVNGVLYAVGGDPAIGAVGTLEAYDPVSGHWTTKATMTTPRTELGAGAVNGLLYAVGGQLANLAATNIVEVYDPGSDKWSAAPSLNVARVGAAVAVAAGRLYVIGGDTLGTMESWGPGEPAWVLGTPMPSGRQFAAAVGMRDSLVYAVGGRDNNNNEVATVQVFNVRTKAWNPGPSMSAPRDFLGVAVVNDTLYAVGGENFANGELTLVEALSPGGVWAPRASLPSRRGFLGVGSVNGFLYAVGGSLMDGALTTVEVYQP